MRIAGIVLVLMVLLGACKSHTGVKDTDFVPPPPAVELNVEATTSTDSIAYYYERTACYGQCPIFKFYVLKTGKAVYIGRNNVNRIGTYHTNLDNTSLQKIDKAAESIGYFSFDSIYDDPNKMDVPSKITVVPSKDGSKKVMNRVKGPKSLESLYTAFDEVIESAQWKLVE
ncbi:MAG: hypothetical protein RL204_1995 [Bacteroidota bacterium]|jgi:hypothetical protein